MKICILITYISLQCWLFQNLRAPLKNRICKKKCISISRSQTKKKKNMNVNCDDI